MKNENQNIEYKSVYNNWMMIYNNGKLPEDWTIETLTAKHASEPANPDIAKAFFRAGYIEVWGRGISNIIDYCVNAALPAPYYKKMGHGISIIFEKEPGSCNFGRIEDRNLSETTRKMSEKILKLLSERPQLSAKIIAEIMNKSPRTIEREIDKLKTQNRLKRIGAYKGGYWEVITSSWN